MTLLSLFFVRVCVINSFNFFLRDARELRYTSCRLALLSVLRSWTGTIEFCDPSKPSGLKAIVDALYLNQLEVRVSYLLLFFKILNSFTHFQKAILDLLYELLGLPQPALTDDYAAALQAVDPSDLQVSYYFNSIQIYFLSHIILLNRFQFLS